MKSTNLIGPVEVIRDEDGYWYHPGIPDSDDEDPSEYIDWVRGQGLKIKGWHLGDELSFDQEENVLDWNPESPGEGWFLMGIFETEDGCYVQWAKRLEQGEAWRACALAREKEFVGPEEYDSGYKHLDEFPEDQKK